MPKENFISGFLLNPRALSNYKRSKTLNIEYNFKGEGEIKGGLFIIGSGKSGIAYQFIERNFGDWAPLAEVIEICTQMQKVIIIVCSIFHVNLDYAVLTHKHRN